MVEEDIDKLFSMSEDKYGPDYKDKLFEQYKLFLQMIDSLTNKRTKDNRFFLSINTGLLTTFGLIIQLRIDSSEYNIFWIIGGVLAGIVFSYSWINTIRSHTKLSAIKWKIIWEIEKKLPLQIHEIEWRLLGSGTDRKKYHKLTDAEQVVPFIFIAIYVCILYYHTFKFDSII